MKKLRSITRKPIVLSPVWPNVGVEAGYRKSLDVLIDESFVALIRSIAAAWRETPPLFVSDEAPLATAAGIILRTPDDRVLLMRRTDGRGWAFPGGSIEANETAEAAARREVFEETLHPCNGPLQLVNLSRPEHGRVIFATFTAEVLEAFTPTMNSEHDAFVWLCPVDAVRQGLKLHPGVHQAMVNMFDTLANDAPSSTKALQALLAKWGAQTIKRFDLVSQQLALGFGGRSMQATQTAMSGQLKKAGFIIAFKPTQRSLEALRAVTAENVALIKSIPRKWHEQIEQKVWNAVRNGSNLSELSIDLRKTYGSTVKRAALIARDQNAKAKAVIERVRRQELGIKRAIWMHSHAGKEPRPTHVAMNNKPYELTQGMWDSDEQAYIWPGELINCRCSDRAVIEGAEDAYDDHDEQPAFAELAAALRNATQYAGTGRAAEMREILQRYRDARTVWVDHMQLRTDIDDFLNSEV